MKNFWESRVIRCHFTMALAFLTLEQHNGWMLAVSAVHMGYENIRLRLEMV